MRIKWELNVFILSQKLKLQILKNKIKKSQLHLTLNCFIKFKRLSL